MKSAWGTKKLKFIVSRLTNGYVGPTKNIYKESGVPYLLARHVKSNTLTFDGKTFVDDEFNLKNKKSILKAGDVLLVQSGHIGHSAVVPEMHEGHNCHAMIVITPITDILNGQFLSLYFLSPFMQIQFESMRTGSTLKHLNCKDVRELDIPIPPLDEQIRIVEILDEAFAAIAKAKANTEKNLQNAKELFNNYLHSIVTNEGADWEIKKLSEVAEYFNGLTYSPKDVNDKGIIVLRSSNVQNDELDFSDIVRVNLPVKDKIKVQDGDILMCSRNGSKRLVGKTAIIKNLREVMTFGTFMMIIRSQYNPYLSWYFKSNDFRKQISMGENTMINQITRYMLDDLVLSFPSIKMQNEIVQKLNAFSFEIRKLETIYQRKLHDLEELKKSILQKAFSGELIAKELSA